MITLIVIIIMLIVLYNLYIHIEIGYKQKDCSNQMFILISMIKGLIKFHVKLLDIHIDTEEKTFRIESIKSKSLKDKENKYTFKELKHSIKRAQYLHNKYRNILEYMMNKMKIKKILFNIEFDTKNAAVTGILSGIIYTVVTNIFFWISSYKNIETHQLDVKPLFIQQNLLHIDFSCIITFKLGQIINVGIKILKLYLKGGD